MAQSNTRIDPAAVQWDSIDPRAVQWDSAPAGPSVGQEAANPQVGPLQGELPGGFNPAAAVIAAGKGTDKIKQGVDQAKNFANYAIARLLPGADKVATHFLDQLETQRQSEAEKDRLMKPLEMIHPGSTMIGSMVPAVVSPNKALPLVAAMEYGTPGERAMRAGGAYLGNKAAEKLGGMAANRVAQSEMEVAQQAPMRAVAEASRAKGFVIPPSQTNPGVVNNALEGFAGKLTTAQQASATNAREVIPKLIREEFDIPERAVLNAERFSLIRAEAGKAYDAVKKATPAVARDEPYAALMADVRAKFGAADDALPNEAVAKLVDGFDKPMMSTGRMIEEIKRLRFHASRNAKNFDDPVRAELGKAQREIADGMEDLIDRNLVAKLGENDLVANYRAARVKIAKAWTAQDALNEATGTFSAKAIAKDKRATGNLKAIGDFHRAFPKASQDVEKIGSMPGISPLDYFASGVGGLGGALTGNPLFAVAPFARPGVRAGILSGPYQSTMGAASGKPEGMWLKRLLENEYAPAAGGLLGYEVTR